MATNPSYLKYLLSGGAANTAPNSSIGGAASTTSVVNESATEGTAITGVTIDKIGGLPVGTIDLVFDSTNTTLSLNSGTAIDIATNGQYHIPNTGTAGGFVDVTITAGSLPGSDVTNTLTVSVTQNNLFDDILTAEVLAGMTDYRCFYIENSDSTDAFLTVSVSIETQPNGLDSIEIGLDPAGKNGTAATIANETTAPTGVTFGTSSLTVTGGLAAGDDIPVWIKRTIPATSGPAVPVDLSVIKTTVTYVE